MLGHSLGGYLSLEMAIAHPERTAALVLVDTGPGFRNDAARDGWNEMAEGYARDLDERGLGGLPGSDELSASVHRSAAGLALAARGVLRQSDGHVLEALPSIDVPTLVVVGERDKPFLNGSRYMADKIPGATLAVIDGAGPRPARQPSRRVQRRAAIVPRRAGGRPMSAQDEVRADVRAWLAEHWDPDAGAARLAPPARRQRLGHADVADRLVRPWAARLGRRRRRRGVRRRRRRGRGRRGRDEPRRADAAGPRLRRAQAAAAAAGDHRRGHVVPAVQRAGQRVRPRRAVDAGRAATATSGSSTARSCGARAPTTPTTGCCWPAPTRTCPSTAASATSCCRCTSPASRSARCGR